MVTYNHYDSARNVIHNRYYYTPAPHPQPHWHQGPIYSSTGEARKTKLVVPEWYRPSAETIRATTTSTSTTSSSSLGATSGFSSKAATAEAEAETYWRSAAYTYETGRGCGGGATPVWFTNEASATASARRIRAEKDTAAEAAHRSLVRDMVYGTYAVPAPSSLTGGRSLRGRREEYFVGVDDVRGLVVEAGGKGKGKFVRRRRV
ncbi:hypothetical protein L13192_03019 [Pyrenophora tritici-repentis]|nr:hypothetical protein L13192_03019 [Pyrenophora tritici-repentis]